MLGLPVIDPVPTARRGLPAVASRCVALPPVAVGLYQAAVCVAVCQVAVIIPRGLADRRWRSNPEKTPVFDRIWFFRGSAAVAINRFVRQNVVSS